MKHEFSKFYEISQSDIPLIEYTNIFIGNLVWMQRGIDKDIATYDLVVREKPENWNFYVFDGLERMLDNIINYGFDENAIIAMKAMGLIDSEQSEKFYKTFKFSGDIWSMKDGTIFFPGEPIVRVTAPICEANMLTAFMLNAFGYPTRLLTKCVRVVLAAEGKPVMSTSSSVVRLPGFEQSIYSLRACKLLNLPIVSPIFYKKFPQYLDDKKRVVVNINHAVIKSFDTESDAYEYVLTELVKKADLFLLMVDTYNLKKGLDHFIEVLKKYPDIDKGKFMITIDSGDLAEQSFYVRETLDKDGLQGIKIHVFSNLDEYSINKMIRAGAPIDMYVAATEVVNITDNPRFEAVYKMAELRHYDGKIEQKAKLTKGKESYPGRKQVFRIYENEKMVRDIIGLEDEKLGEPLIQKFIENGELVLDIPTLEDTKTHLYKELATLPEKYKDVNKGVGYPVEVSEKMSVLLKEVKKKHS